MGLERVMASSKLSPENAEFLDDVARSLRPYPVSQSSLVDTMVSIVRKLSRNGTVNLEPKALQELLGNEGRPGSEGRRKGAQP